MELKRWFTGYAQTIVVENSLVVAILNFSVFCKFAPSAHDFVISPMGDSNEFARFYNTFETFNRDEAIKSFTQ